MCCSTLLILKPMLQVLHLARCGLHDPGGAAICMAVRQHPALSEVDLSWNALGHNTARAVEAAFRYDYSNNVLVCKPWTLHQKRGLYMGGPVADSQLTRAARQSTAGAMVEPHDVSSACLPKDS